MKRDIRALYLTNLICHIACDWIFAVFVRHYSFGPYGVYYCEGWMSTAGLSKPLIMVGYSCQGTMAVGIIMVVSSFFCLMIRLHQVTVTNVNSRWKLSNAVQFIIYAMITGICVLNVAGCIIFSTDVDNYADLIKDPELAWMVERGGTLLLFGEPGKKSRFTTEALFLLASACISIPLLLFFTAHAMIYLHRNEKLALSTKTQLLTHRLFSTFELQLRGAIMFFITPLIFMITSSVVDLSHFLPDPVFAALRFLTIMLVGLTPPQFGLVFILRNATHRKMLIRRILKI
ncbi:hypothetical protein PENTCL1PPCAC_14654, partial [Pristionchus entomophagus]